jgi:hypothetical protein
VTEKKDIEESWVKVERVNETHYEYKAIELNDYPVTKAAMILSIVIGCLSGFILVLGAIYGVNMVYINIIEMVANASKYSNIEKKDDTNLYEPLMGEDEGSNQQKGKGDDVPQMSYNIFKLIRQLFVLAPPLSAFVDYLCVLVSKKYINSAEAFYQHIFLEKNSKDVKDDELHDLEKEQITGKEMKTLYEKFCYLNGLLELKLDDENNLKVLARYGFKIETKSDSLTECYHAMLQNK